MREKLRQMLITFLLGGEHVFPQYVLLTEEAVTWRDEATRALEKRIDDLEKAYANDPRRLEIAKEKAEAPKAMGGFIPRSKRVAIWEGERRAKPKK